MILDLLNNINIDSSFSKNINESKYTEGNTNNNNKSYKNIVECIINEFDPLIIAINHNERKMYLKQKIMKICSDIEEKSDINYDNYKFNTRVMKKNIIQQSLQMYDKQNNISSIYYLNEYYKKHFVIIYNDKSYDTCIKDYPKIYIKINNSNITIVSDTYPREDIQILFDKNIIQNDIKKDKSNVYKTYLDTISKYKIEDLRKIATECNISLKDLNKNKTKNILYEEINMYKLNN